MSYSRRSFLKKSLAVGAGMTAANILSPLPAEAGTKETPRPEDLEDGASPVLASSRGAAEPSSLPSDDPLLLRIRQAKYINGNPKVASLGLLHFSDIHGDDIAARQLLSAISTYGSYMDAVLNTGDAALYFADPTPKFPHGAAWWRSSGLAEKSLFVMGNHDGADGSDAKGHKEGSADWDFKGKEWDFDTYFADYIKGLGCTMPEGYDNPASPYFKSCFWLKDFPEAKIRLFGLDCIHFNEKYRYKTDEQERWFAAKLAETLDPSSPVYGYSVLAASHYPLDDFNGLNEEWDESVHKFRYNTKADGGVVVSPLTGTMSKFHTTHLLATDSGARFALRQRIPDASASYGYRKSETNPFGDILQAWQEKGGKFIAWLCGHFHCDMFYYPAKYPGLLCVAVDQAGNLRGNAITDRDPGLVTRYCANYYAIDTQSGLFKIVRIGLPINRFLVKKDVLCYDYIHREVIAE